MLGAAAVVALSTALVAAVPEVSVLVVPVVVGPAAGGGPAAGAAATTHVRASDLEAAVSVAARERRSVRLMSSEEAFVAGVGLDQVAACGVDPACVSRLLGPTRAELAMLIVANVLVDPPLLALRVFELQSGRLVASSAAPVGDRALAAAVSARAAAMFQELGHRRFGRLRLEVTPPAAVVMLQGGDRSEIAAAGMVEVEPGPWSVSAQADGYTPGRAEVVAIEGEEATVRLVLEEEPSLFASPWFWTAVIGTAVVAGAAAVVVGTRGGECVCLGGPAQSCPPC